MLVVAVYVMANPSNTNGFQARRRITTLRGLNVGPAKLLLRDEDLR